MIPQDGLLNETKSNSSQLRTVAISCGIWTCRDSKLVFVPYFDLAVSGTLKFTSKMAIVSLEGGLRIDLDFYAIREVNLEGLPQSAITMTLTERPRFLRPKLDSLGSFQSPHQPAWTRIPCLNSKHEILSGTCLVYRIRFRKCFC